MHREPVFLKLLHVSAVAFTTALLLPLVTGMLVGGPHPESMTRSFHVAEYDLLMRRILWLTCGAVAGLILGYLSWNHMIRKHPDWDERIIAMGCLTLLLLLPVVSELLRYLNQLS